MPPRARPLPPDDRRDVIVAATLPLVLEHGRAVTTRQIATAAGVAEGTIFRVFESKDDVVDAAITSAFDLAPYLRAIEQLDTAGTLDEILTAVAQAMIDRFSHVFRMLTVLGIKGPPPMDHSDDCRPRIEAAHRHLLADHADELTLPPREVMRYVRFLAFSGSNPHITDGEVMTAAEIASVVLDGTRKAR